MENSKHLIKRLLIVAIIAFAGALVFDAMIVAADLLYPARHHLGHWVVTFGWLLMIPSFAVTAITANIPDPYWVNGVLGACSFAIVAGLWQFVFQPLRRIP